MVTSLATEELSGPKIRVTWIDPTGVWTSIRLSCDFDCDNVTVTPNDGGVFESGALTPGQMYTYLAHAFSGAVGSAGPVASSSITLSKFA